MKTIECKREEIFPIIDTLLQMAAYRIYCFAMKFAVRDYFPDLQVTVNTDELTDCTISLLKQVKDYRINMLEELSRQMILSAYRIKTEKKTGYDITKSTEKIVSNLYFDLILDLFPAYQPVQHLSNREYDLYLDVYLQSLIRLMENLIVITEKDQTTAEWNEQNGDYFLLINTLNNQEYCRSSNFRKLFMLIHRLECSSKYFVVELDNF